MLYKRADVSWGYRGGIRRAICLALLLALALAVPPAAAEDLASEQPAVEAPRRPNLLLFISDDQRADTMEMMPATTQNFDVAFTTAVATTPNCCPSRASILSGQYAHSHGVLNNAYRKSFLDNEPDSLGPWLQQQGYHTGYIGKYLNAYMSTEPIPPGWDEFQAHAAELQYEGQSPFRAPVTDGDWHTNFYLREKEGGPTPRDEFVKYPNASNPSVYSTRFFGERAVRFIRRAHDPQYNAADKPWALVVSLAAPHYPYTVEPQYMDAPVPTWKPRPSYLEPDMSDKPAEIFSSPLWMRTDGTSYPSIRKRSLRMLLSVDDTVDRLFDVIDDFGEREQTWGIYTSDNGVSWGEHRLGQKLHAYEESIRVPFRMAVPHSGARVNDAALIANIDIAPTLLDIAGGQARASVDGTSIKHLALGETGPCLCNRDIVIENRRVGLTYRALRTRRWTYVAWPSGRTELYDLARDPYQLNNVTRRYPRVVQVLDERMHAEMAR